MRAGLGRRPVNLEAPRESLRAISDRVALEWLLDGGAATAPRSPQTFGAPRPSRGAPLTGRHPSWPERPPSSQRQRQRERRLFRESRARTMAIDEAETRAVAAKSSG